MTECMRCFNTRLIAERAVQQAFGLTTSATHAALVRFDTMMIRRGSMKKEIDPSAAILAAPLVAIITYNFRFSANSFNFIGKLSAGSNYGKSNKNKKNNNNNQLWVRRRYNIMICILRRCVRRQARAILYSAVFATTVGEKRVRRMYIEMMAILGI